MSTAAATAAIDVPCDPDTAFALFTSDIGRWWKRGTRYWNDAERGQELRFEPGPGGRLTEVHDRDTGAGFEIGRVLAWEPGRRLVFTWRQDDWGPGESTEVEVRFEAWPVEGGGAGTRVTVEHRGWDRVPSAGPGPGDGYGAGWAELLGFYAGFSAQRAQAPRAFIHLALHYPHAEHAADLLASMQRVDAAAQGAPGLLEIGAWRDERTGCLVGLARWESAEAWQASAEQIFAVVADDPFDQWCERPPDVFHLTRPEPGTAER
jgi:uncharacterized protein YndB with AHSA1/START domain